MKIRQLFAQEDKMLLIGMFACEDKALLIGMDTWMQRMR